MKNVLKVMDEEIERLKRYRGVLQECHTQYPLYHGRASLCPAVREAKELYGRVRKIYESYRVELGLEDKARYLQWMYTLPENMSKIGFNPLQPLSECIDKLEGLRYKKNRELFQKAQTTQREGKGKKTPAPQVEGNKTTGDLTFGGEPLTLDTLDIKLLGRLNQDIGKTVSKDNLMVGVWGENRDKHPYEDQLYIRIGNLKRAFRDLKIPAEIINISGVGYKLNPRNNIAFVIK